MSRSPARCIGRELLDHLWPLRKPANSLPTPLSSRPLNGGSTGGETSPTSYWARGWELNGRGCIGQGRGGVGFEGFYRVPLHSRAMSESLSVVAVGGGNWQS